MKRKASAEWKADSRTAKEQFPLTAVSLSNAVLVQHPLRRRKGTNPEELIAAARRCFSMALSGQLGTAGAAASIRTTANVTLEKLMLASLSRRAPRRHGEDPGRQSKFETAANNARLAARSRLLNTKITMDAKRGLALRLFCCLTF